jgi:hypothetical protein
MARANEVLMFKALAQKARMSKDKEDVRNAMRFGIEKRVRNDIIRQNLY